MTVPPSDRVQRRPARGRVIAVTGARTFLGRNLIALLEEDPAVAKVVAIDLRNADTAGVKTCFYELDLTQSGVESKVAEILQAEKVSCLCHLAFSGGPAYAAAWAHELDSVGTMHVLSACRQVRLPKLVMVTSTLVYGPHAKNPNHLPETAPLRGIHGAAYIEDRRDVERQIARFREESEDTQVAVLRMAPVLGPTVQNYLTRWLSRAFVPVVMGHDPLLQFVHEVDAVAALKLAVDVHCDGTFNIVGRGVLPVSTVVRLAGRVALPMPFAVLRRLMSLLWVAQLIEAPPEFAFLLRYLCVADGTLAERELGYRPAYSVADAVLDFEGAQRLRDARLLERTT